MQVEEVQLGSFLRASYLDPASPTFIEGINTDVANISQLLVRADAASEGSVIVNSAYGLLQGLYPPTSDNNITLSNGTTVISPLGGYQYIPGKWPTCLRALVYVTKNCFVVETVEPNEDISLNSFTSCPVRVINL